MSVEWRSSGDVSLLDWMNAFPLASLMRTAGELSDAYAAAKGLTRLCLGMLAAESSYATAFNADPETNKNALNLRPRGGGSGFLAFPSWSAGIAEWKSRLTSTTYAYKDTQTVAELVSVYAPASDSNDTAAYVQTVETVIARYTPIVQATGGIPVTVYPNYAVAGLATKIVLPVPLIQAILPAGQTNQRPGIKRQTPGLFVVHETANTAAGADAAMHARYLANGADGSQVSWHFSVDDHQIYQHIPVDEVTWQSADGSGPGNMSGVSCELCVNSDGNEALTRRNAEALVGTICAALGLTTGQIKRHWDMNAGNDPTQRHHCPDHMMNEGYWPQFVANAGVVIAANSAPPPKPNAKWAKKRPIPHEDASHFKLGKKLTATQDVTPRASADPAAPATAPDVKKGQTIVAAWIQPGTDGKLWVAASGGSRFPLSAFQ